MRVHRLEERAPLSGHLTLLWAAAIALFANFAPLPGFWLYDQRRILLVALLLIAVVAGFGRLGRTPLSAAAPLGLAALLGLLSAALAEVKGHATLEWALLVATAAATLCLVCAVDGAFLRRRLFPLLGLGVVLYGFIALAIFAIARFHSGYTPWPEPVHHFTNIRFLNQFQSWMLPLLPALLFARLYKARPAFVQLLFGGYFALLFTLLLYTGGRGSLAGLTGTLLLMPLLFGREGAKWSAILLATAAVALLLLFGLFPESGGGNFDSIGRKLLYSSGRLELFHASLLLIGDTPLLGIGPMNFAALDYKLSHPHDFPLQIAAEWGVPAALLVAFTILHALYRWLRFASARVKEAACPAWERMYIMSLTGSLLTAGAHSLVSGVVVMPMSLLMLVLVTSLTYDWYRRYRPAPNPASTPKAVISRAWRAVALAAALWLALVTGIEVVHYQETRDVATAAGSGFQPRFWLQGGLSHLSE